MMQRRFRLRVGDTVRGEGDNAVRRVNVELSEVPWRRRWSLLSRRGHGDLGSWMVVIVPVFLVKFNINTK